LIENIENEPLDFSGSAFKQERKIDDESLGKSERKSFLIGLIKIMFRKQSLVKIKEKKKIINMKRNTIRLSDLTHQIFKSPLLHYSRETVHDSLKKLTQYSMLGAAKRVQKGRAKGNPGD
jgi:hypothetical protein